MRKVKNYILQSKNDPFLLANVHEVTVTQTTQEIVNGKIETMTRTDINKNFTIVNDKVAVSGTINFEGNVQLNIDCLPVEYLADIQDIASGEWEYYKVIAETEEEPNESDN